MYLKLTRGCIPNMFQCVKSAFHFEGIGHQKKRMYTEPLLYLCFKSQKLEQVKKKVPFLCWSQSPCVHLQRTPQLQVSSMFFQRCSINQWFSTGDNFNTQGHLTLSGDSCGCPWQREACHWHAEGGGQGAYDALTTAPHSEELSGPKCRWC